MTPERRRSFERNWGALEPRLRRLLAAKSVPPADRDDLVQETATRLCSVWDHIDVERAWPYTATIVLNLLRDARRAPHVEVAEVGEAMDVAVTDDPEAVSLARVELSTVGRAMASLSQAQRDALLAPFLNGSKSSAAEKMLRMRARRKLAVMVERVSAVVAWRLQRMLHALPGLAPGRDEALAALSCLACLAFGSAAGVTTLAPAAARAAPLPQTLRSAAPAWQDGTPEADAPKAAWADGLDRRSAAGRSSDRSPHRGHAAQAATGDPAPAGDEGTPPPSIDDVPDVGRSIPPPPDPGEVDEVVPSEVDEVRADVEIVDRVVETAVTAL